MSSTAISPLRRNLVLATMCLSLVLVVAGVSMLSNALPDIAQGLGLSQTSQTWVVDAYALALASLLLVAGALGDRYGRRGALAAGTVLFGTGALLSAYADSGSWGCLPASPPSPRRPRRSLSRSPRTWGSAAWPSPVLPRRRS